MQTARDDISERLLEFGAGIITLIVKLSAKRVVGRHIARQLLRSSTSSGANYEEACAAESKADFVHKMQVVLKELRESLYWLKLAKKALLLPDESLQPLVREADELARIFARSIITAKGSGE